MSEEDDRFFESESPTVLARRRTHVFSGVTVSSGLGLLGTYSEQVTSGHHENIVTLGSQELFGGSAPGQRPRGSTIVHASSENNLTSPYSHSVHSDEGISRRATILHASSRGQGPSQALMNSHIISRAIAKYHLLSPPDTFSFRISAVGQVQDTDGSIGSADIASFGAAPALTPHFRIETKSRRARPLPTAASDANLADVEAADVRPRSGSHPPVLEDTPVPEEEEEEDFFGTLPALSVTELQSNAFSFIRQACGLQQRQYISIFCHYGEENLFSSCSTASPPSEDIIGSRNHTPEGNMFPFASPSPPSQNISIETPQHHHDYSPFRPPIVAPLSTSFPAIPSSPQAADSLGSFPTPTSSVRNHSSSFHSTMGFMPSSSSTPPLPCLLNRPTSNSVSSNQMPTFVSLPPPPIKALGRQGRSSSQFYRCVHDNRVLVKTVSQTEAELLAELAPRLADHLTCGKRSLITPILGLYQVVPSTGKAIHFVTMADSFSDRQYAANPIPAWTVYDLKGCDRSAVTRGLHTRLDYEFRADGQKIVVPPQVKHAIFAAATHDAMFLEREGLMDYSLLLAVESSVTNKSLVSDPTMDELSGNLTPSSPASNAISQLMDARGWRDWWMSDSAWCKWNVNRLTDGGAEDLDSGLELSKSQKAIRKGQREKEKKEEERMKREEEKMKRDQEKMKKEEEKMKKEEERRRRTEQREAEKKKREEEKRQEKEKKEEEKRLKIEQKRKLRENKKSKSVAGTPTKQPTSPESSISSKQPPPSPPSVPPLPNVPAERSPSPPGLIFEDLISPESPCLQGKSTSSPSGVKLRSSPKPPPLPDLHDLADSWVIVPSPPPSQEKHVPVDSPPMTGLTRSNVSLHAGLCLLTEAGDSAFCENEKLDPEEADSHTWQPSISRVVSSADGMTRYHLGLIDLLQRYTVQKKVERFLKKGLLREAETTSTSPDQYAARFLRFVDEVVVEAEATV